MKTLAALLLYVATAATGQLLLRVGTRSLGAAHLGPTQWSFWTSAFGSPWVLGGILAWVFSTVLWMAILSRTELSYAYGFAALGYLVVPMAAWRWLGEPLSPLRIVGMIFVAVGVACVFVSRGAAGAP